MTRGSGRWRPAGAAVRYTAWTVAVRLAAALAGLPVTGAL